MFSPRRLQIQIIQKIGGHKQRSESGIKVGIPHQIEIPILKFDWDWDSRLRFQISGFRLCILIYGILKPRRPIVMTNSMSSSI